MNGGPATPVDRRFGNRDWARAPDGAIALGWIGFGAVIRWLALARHEVNSDEPQHLHVAWGWTHGLLPYRDLFDNHAPLFSFAFAPLLSVLGPRADIVVLMRVAMVPLMILTLWGTWIIARRLFDSRTALWAVAFASLQPDMVTRGIEYRSDTLWMALWVLFLATALSGRVTVPRMLGAGLLLGASFATSMKTIPLAGGFVLAALIAFALRARGPAPAEARPRWANLAALGLGASLVPALFVAYFAGQGGLRAMVYCVASHNVVPGLGNWRAGPWLPLLAVPAIPLVILGAVRILRAAPSTDAGVRRAVLWMTIAFYWLAIEAVWPLVTRQDWLPFVPMACVLLASATRAVGNWLSNGHSAARNLAGRGAWRLASLILLLGVVVLWRGESPLENRAKLQQDALGEILRLAAPADSIMDPRGEAIFRARPYYYAFEAVTRARIDAGLLADRVPERLVSSRTAVVSVDSSDFPEGARRFMDENYLSVGTWRVLGHILPASADSAARKFYISVPQRYTAATAVGQARGNLDGRRFDGPRQLKAGMHTYRAAPGEGPVAVFWAPAAQRGFSPFH